MRWGGEGIKTTCGVRIQLDDLGLAQDLQEFLQRCTCAVRQDGPTLHVQLDQRVSVEAALAMLRRGRCYRCGQRIEAVLAEIGSTLCHDCRDAGANGGGAADIDERALASEWARMEIEAYVRVWRAHHPEVDVRVLD